jgi:alkanesulfonate monooxygenase SsuD/methylene tetrahydromethanopterin reductase-like flavin-dependent oxidoreductase (luciferase family)
MASPLLGGLFLLCRIPARTERGTAMDARTCKFGILDLMEVTPSRPTRQSLVEHCALLRAGDALGLDYLFVAERHFVRDQRATSASVLLATLAATTSRSRLGALAYTLPLHNAVLLAEELSMLDHLSGGRLDVGVGLGHVRDELSKLNVPVETRQDRLRESLMMMHALWQGAPTTFHGNMYDVTDVIVDPPLQHPHPPIWYAGTDPTAITWAAGHGLNVALGFQPDDTLQAPADAFRAARPSGSGTKLAVVRRIAVADTNARAKAEVIASFAHQHAAHGAAHHPSSTDLERLYADRQTRQVVIAGDPDSVAREIARTITRLGADVFIGIPSYPSDGQARALSTLDLFTTAVIPRVRDYLVA